MLKNEAISKSKAVGTHVIMWEISEWIWSYRKEKLCPNTRSIQQKYLLFTQDIFPNLKQMRVLIFVLGILCLH